MLDSSLLSVVIRIDNADPEYRGERRADGSWIVELDVVLGVEYSVAASWYANMDDRRLLILEQQGIFFADANTRAAKATIDSDLTSGDQHFDSDMLGNAREYTCT